MPITTTLAPGLYESEMEVKKSRFLGYAQHAATWKEAQDFLEVVKEMHPKSRHIAFGFVAGYNPVQERCSDDGEPTGTAGLPVLGECEGIEDTLMFRQSNHVQAITKNHGPFNQVGLRERNSQT